MIICGDALEELRKISGGSVDMVITSPPYNVGRQYGQVTDERPWTAYYAYMLWVLKELKRVLVPGGVLALNVPMFVRWQRDHKYAHTWHNYIADYQTHRGVHRVTGRARVEPVGVTILQQMMGCGFYLREPIVWVKAVQGTPLATTNQMGSDNNPYMRSCHEHILLASKDQWHHRGGTGRRGREAVPYADWTKDVWMIAPRSNPNHPATFPLEIPERLIRLFVHAADGVVIDPFAGSGTVGVAAVRRGLNKYVLIDANQQYCKLAERNIHNAIQEARQTNLI